MKTFTTLLLATVTSVSINANAGSLDNNQEVWSEQYEEWINPADFNPIPQANLASALHDMQSNPPAAQTYTSLDLDSVFGINSDEEYKHY